jgi:hypothetical protein
MLFTCVQVTNVLMNSDFVKNFIVYVMRYMEDCFFVEFEFSTMNLLGIFHLRGVIKSCLQE